MKKNGLIKCFEAITLSTLGILGTLGTLYF
jgi:hypothetical protein